jgi:endonuclease/exonuclease/phosphatase family metal-dependent hydrolase
MRSTPWLAALLVASGCGGGGGADGPTVAVKVMTRNLYLGADLLPVVTAPTVDAIPMRVDELWQKQMANDIRNRLKLVADEIAAAMPDLIGLQEVETFYRQQPGDFDFANPKINATEVSVDFLAELLADLSARGLRYRDVAVTRNVDVELPGGPPGARFDVRMSDRDVILAREGVEVASPKVVNYPSLLTFPLPITGMPSVPVTLLRGLGRVDATVGGARFTFANTHLEVGGGDSGMGAMESQIGTVLKNLQEAQANDLLKELGSVSGPIVLVGDFNSPADKSGTASYGKIAAKFDDAFAATRAVGGFTCCTDDLAAPFTGKTRIDLVFMRAGVHVSAVDVVGAMARTPGGLRASDHLGVVATVLVPQ